MAAVEALLDRGASLHARADDGSKPLDAAVRAEALKVATLLVARGAGIEETDDDGAGSFPDRARSAGGVRRADRGRAEQPGAGAEDRPVSLPRSRANEVLRVESG